ncbi:DUF4253 domain-containing protein [Streptomyces sp. TRM49041]|uniref:DUF4253 domain-containing protein n=1 Tax=Streptomyces sp. TRM49041 TaxID=2603216 RepID=UPI0011EBB390|nr:DUF4253 domain-containing protein [Streptomyces sp. TRM49041]
MVINPNALGLDLPPGTVRVHPSYWFADEPATHDTWSRLLPAREAAGLQPVLLTERQHLSASQSGEDADDRDLLETLTKLWDFVQPIDEEGQDAQPWPGLAPPGTPAREPDAQAVLLAAELATDDRYFKGTHAALVPARRSADIVTALGWGGAFNHADAAALATVLRSWEDRFGIRLVGLGSDIMSLSVAAPPRTWEHALAVAAEHHAFCPDNVWQGADSLEEYATEWVLNQTEWSFWWD